MKNLLLGTVVMVMALGLTANSAKAQIAPWEDCLSFSYQTAEVKQYGSDWKIVDGSHWMFSFGNKRGEARRALRIIKKYRMANSCYVGRPGPSMKYLLKGNGKAPRGEKLAGEDCIPFNTADVRVQYVNSSSSWKLVAQNMWMLDFGPNRDEAVDSLRAIRKHGFNRQCFVGRPQASFSYWKKVNPAAQTQKPDLGAYGFLKIGQHKRLVRWNETITLRPGDEFLVSGGKPAFNLYYSEKNYGQKKGSGYKNTWYLNGQVVSIQSNRSLNPGEKKDIWTQAYLKARPGVSILELRVDSGNSVAESSETNNRFRVRIRFDGF